MDLAKRLVIDTMEAPSPTAIQPSTKPRRVITTCGDQTIDCGDGFCCDEGFVCASLVGQNLCQVGVESFILPSMASTLSMSPPIGTTLQTVTAGDVQTSTPTRTATPLLSTSTEAPSTNSDTKDLPGGAIAGLIVGLLLAVVLLAGFLLLYRSRRPAAEHERREDHGKIIASSSTLGVDNARVPSSEWLERRATPSSEFAKDDIRSSEFAKDDARSSMSSV